MKKWLPILTAASLLAPLTAFASGYRIPEQSVNSIALSGAYVAHTPGADASYYNPANMTGLADRWQLAGNIAYINLPKMGYTDNAVPARNGKSKEEQFLIPHIFAVSPAVNNFRFGLALTTPAGLSKRWQDAFPRISAEDFTLKVMELNPSVAWQSCEKFSIAGGVRIIRAEGEVRSYGTVPVPGPTTATIRRDLEGETTEYGYNLAATLKPTQELSLSVTYRSKVNLNLEGDATLWSDAIPAIPLPATTLSRTASVSVPVPAVLNLAAAYTFDKTTVELTYDKTYWSAYENLDFNYNAPLVHPVLVSAFDDAKAKNWSNANTYRIGVTHKCTDKWTAMLGFAIDENPVPDNTLGFELPDSDSKIYSIGTRYKYNDNLDVGIAYLYCDKESRSIPAAAANSSSINGTFDDGGAHMFSLGFQYNF